MGIRLPKRWWQWAQLFSPAAIMLLTTAYDVYFIPRAGRMIVGLDGAVIGGYVAIPLCVVLAFFLTNPSAVWSSRLLWVVLGSVVLIFANSAIAFAGCLLVTS